MSLTGTEDAERQSTRKVWATSPQQVRIQRAKKSRWLCTIALKGLREKAIPSDLFTCLSLVDDSFLPSLSRRKKRSRFCLSHCAVKKVPSQEVRVSGLKGGVTLAPFLLPVCLRQCQYLEDSFLLPQWLQFVIVSHFQYCLAEENGKGLFSSF